MAMEDTVEVDFPRANDSKSTEAFDVDEALAGGSVNSLRASGGFTMDPSSSLNEFPITKELTPPSVASDVVNDHRFRLGIETGRWFLGSHGDVYELLDSIGSGSASTVYKCKKVRSNQASRTSDGPCQTGLASSQEAEAEVLAVKAIDLKGLRLTRNFDREMEKLRREVRSAPLLPSSA